VGAADAEAVEHRQRVAGELRERIWSLREGAGRAACVSVVVAKHAVALGQPGDQRLGPRDPGGIGAHDQQQGRGIRVTRCVRPQPDCGLGVDQALLVVAGGVDGRTAPVDDAYADALAEHVLRALRPPAEDAR
jgi:hypothetical protein